MVPQLKKLCQVQRRTSKETFHGKSFTFTPNGNLLAADAVGTSPVLLIQHHQQCDPVKITHKKHPEYAKQLPPTNQILDLKIKALFCQASDTTLEQKESRGSKTGKVEELTSSQKPITTRQHALSGCWRLWYRPAGRNLP